MSLNTQQSLAVTTTSPRILCVAGPGSGKTRVLIERIRRLIADAAQPNRIVAITFTVASANEIARRLDAIKLGYLGTLHGFALRCLREHGHAIGFAPHVSVLDEDQADDLMHQVATDLHYRGTETHLVAEIAKGPMPGTQPRKGVEIVAAEFFRRLRKQNCVTFDTSLHYMLRVCQFVTAFDHLMVDEAQDNASTDWAIYRALPIANKFMIGDTDQSIYGFRGADPTGMADLATYAAVIRLETNYRSDQTICHVANRLIEHNQERIRKQIISASSDDGWVTAREYETPISEMANAATMLRDGRESAVLIRTNALAQQWTDYLSGLGIPVVRRRQSELPSDWAYARNLLQFLDDPDNDALCYRWLVEDRGKELATAERTKAEAASVTLNSRTCRAVRLIDMGALRTLVEHKLTVDMWARIADLIEDGTVDIGELLVRLQETSNTVEEDGKGVVVCTLHGAKGREFDRVLMPAFEQDIIPGTRKGTNLDEERRLAFVGMTRARHELHISWCAERRREWTADTMARKSQFIEEAGL